MDTERRADADVINAEIIKTMKKHLSLCLGLLLFWSFPGVNAESFKVLPFTKGSFSEIKEQNQNKPFVLVFWSETCGYCMKELAMFGRLQKRFPEVRLVTVSTDPFTPEKTVKEVMERCELELVDTWVFAEQFPEMVYADVSRRWRGELPVTHFFDRDHQETRHLGVVKEEELVAWLEVQSQI